MKQCKACPWKKSTNPTKDIPGGYDEERHKGLASTIAEPGSLNLSGPLKMMACHETPVGQEKPCIGWLAHQLGPGNNLGLRMMAIQGKLNPYLPADTDGPQHERFEDTCPKHRRKRK